MLFRSIASSNAYLLTRFSSQQEFNARTANYVVGTPMPCRVTVRADRSFVFDIRTPQTSWLLLNCVETAPKNKKGQRRGAQKPGSETIGAVSLKHVYEIAKIKLKDSKGVGEEEMCKIVAGSARSMGIRIVR